MRKSKKARGPDFHHPRLQLSTSTQFDSDSSAALRLKQRMLCFLQRVCSFDSIMKQHPPRFMTIHSSVFVSDQTGGSLAIGCIRSQWSRLSVRSMLPRVLLHLIVLTQHSSPPERQKEQAGLNTSAQTLIHLFGGCRCSSNHM